MRLGSAGRIQGLLPGARQRHLPSLLVERMLRGARRMHHQATGVLNLLARRIGVEVHDVVRVHEAHEERPGFALIGQRATLLAQPGHRACTNHRVVGIAALGMCQHIARPDVIREPVGIHFAGEEPVQLFAVECAVQMPLALVRGVVPGLPEHVSNRGYIRRERLHVGHVRVLEHAVVAGLKPGQHHRARAGTHHRRAVVIAEGGAFPAQPLLARQSIARREAIDVALLIAEDEHDVGRLRRGAARACAGGVCAQRCCGSCASGGEQATAYRIRRRSVW